MAATEAQLIDTIELLTHSGEPCSFVDALRIVRMARQLQPISDRAVLSLVSLHDAPQSTDGAREVLARYLGGCAREIVEQRERAARPLTLADDGALVRINVGQRLLLVLDEQPGAGFRWNPVDIPRHVRIAHGTRDTSGDRSLARFEVVASRAGRARLNLREGRPAQIDAAGDKRRPRAFGVTILVEPSPDEE